MTIMAQGATGADYVSGTFTVPADATSYTLEFGKTFSNYIFLVEATDNAKTSIMSSGSTNARGYAYIGVYPKREINSEEYSSNVYVMRVIPSTGTLSNGVTGGSMCSETGITFSTVDVTASGWSSLVKGLTYNYFIVAIDE